MKPLQKGMYLGEPLRTQCPILLGAQQVIKSSRMLWIITQIGVDNNNKIMKNDNSNDRIILDTYLSVD